MPVIRGQLKSKPLSSQKRRALLKELMREREGVLSAGGPIIFEVPLAQSDRMDVLVVWDAMADLRSEDRTDLIMEAYKAQADKIAQAVGVTRKEGIEHGWLPYEVKTVGHRSAVKAPEIRKAMVEEGGFAIDGDFIVLRLPSADMADEALLRLHEKFPQVPWHNEQVIL